ncbi:MAG: hypothetical protein WHS63_13070, partial [Tenuifilum sp.]|uniref:hypothetical protein n=1 Tax=Tenuifilum sp. TaxID=2760880 RepID=UPI0030B08B88
PEEFSDCIVKNDFKAISNKLYRLQKLTIKPSSGQIDIVFRHHLETQIIDDINSKMSKRFYNIQSLGVLFSLNPIKLKIDCIGNITAWNITDRV